MTTRTQTANAPQPLRILVTGATGKTGHRVASRLSQTGHAVRLGSRSTTPAFDWNAPDSWAAALTEDGHDGEIYEVTGPRLLHMSDVAALLSEATGREIRFEPVPHADFVAGVKASGAPEQIVWLMDYLFSVVLDGRNSYVSDGVERALGRPPRDFAVYARQAAASGVWSV